MKSSVNPSESTKNPASTFRWSAAISSGLIVGTLLLIFPRGSPWEGLSFTDPVVMGRDMAGSITALGAVLTHLGLAVAYALLLAPLVYKVQSWRGILLGAGLGLGLYLVNWALFTLALSYRALSEWPTLFTHVFFGLTAAALFKGMTRRRPEYTMDSASSGAQIHRHA